jgi:hypothetical protein
VTPGRCTARCQTATSDIKRCRCACGGSSHGAANPGETGQYADERAPGVPHDETGRIPPGALFATPTSVDPAQDRRQRADAKALRAARNHAAARAMDPRRKP